VVETFVLKKREYKREEEEGAPVRWYSRKDASYAGALLHL
jgi:hypothetical protein